MNTKNSKTNESHRFKYDLIDKLNLMLSQLMIIISLKHQHQPEMKHLTCLMDFIIYQKYQIILNI